MANKKPLKREAGKFKEFAATDTIPANNLGAGTADNTVVLFGDGVWRSPSAGSTDIKQVEIDFGSVPIKNKRFIIIDASVGVSNQIIPYVSYDDPSDGDTDSAEWFEDLQVMAKSGVGQFFLYCNSPYNDLNGKIKINYLIG